MKNKIANFIILALLMLTGIFLGIKYSSLPSEIPVHWNSSGNVDNWSNKSFLFIMYGIFWLVELLMLFIPKIDPKKKNYEKFEDVYNIFRILMTVFFIVIFFIIVYVPENEGFFNMGNTMYFIVSIITFVIGIFFPKIKQNYTFGIKTPWTLDDEEIWNKTHKMASPIWIIGSVIVMITSFIFKSEMVFKIFIVEIVIISTIPLVYSFILFKNKSK